METPTISSSTYGTSTVTSAGLYTPLMAGSSQTIANSLKLNQQRGSAKYEEDATLTNFGINQNLQEQKQLKKEMKMANARIVKVFIADPDENLPLEKRVIYTGEEKLTDLNDNELYFEIPIMDLLRAHNDVRKATVDKKQSEKFGREIMLEAARIRDLKMVVVTVASF